MLSFDEWFSLCWMLIAACTTLVITTGLHAQDWATAATRGQASPIIVGIWRTPLRPVCASRRSRVRASRGLQKRELATALRLNDGVPFTEKHFVVLREPHYACANHHGLGKIGDWDRSTGVYFSVARPSNRIV